MKIKRYIILLFALIVVCSAAYLILFRTPGDETLTELKYESLEILLRDIKENSVGKNVSKDGIFFLCEDNTCIKLLSDTSVEVECNISNIKLDLDNHTLKIASLGSINLSNSTLCNGVIDVSSSGEVSNDYRAINIQGNSSLENCVGVIAGTYNNICFICTEEDSTLVVRDSEISTTNCSADTLYGIYSNGYVLIANSKIYLTNNPENQDSKTYCIGVYSDAVSSFVSDCDIKIQSYNKYGSSYGVYATGKSNLLDVKNTIVYTDSHYLRFNDVYGSLSIGIIGHSSQIYISNCVVRGIHSGAQVGGDSYIEDSYFESTGHGGIYFVQNRQKNDLGVPLPVTSHLNNCTLAWSEPSGIFKDDLLDENFSGSNDSAFYIGGSENATNIFVYMNNCKIIGKRYSGVLRGSSNEYDNSLYVSNTEFNAPMRIDNEMLEFQIGKGCNIEPETEFYWYRTEMIKYCDLPDSLIFFMPEKEFK